MKSEKGITGIDLSISIIIVMLFVSIIAALTMNVSTSLASKRRLDIATECMGKIMEKLDSMNYEDVEETLNATTSEYEYKIIKDVFVPSNSITYNSAANPSKLDNEIAGILTNYDILKVSLKVENYKPEGQTSDLVKKVTVKIEYKLNKKLENLEVTRLKTRYNVDLEHLPSPTATAIPSPTPTVTPTP